MEQRVFTLCSWAGEITTFSNLKDPTKAAHINPSSDGTSAWTWTETGFDPICSDTTMTRACSENTVLWSQQKGCFLAPQGYHRGLQARRGREVKSSGVPLPLQTEPASLGHLLSPKGNFPNFSCFPMVLPYIYISLSSVWFCLFLRFEKWCHVVCNFCDLLLCCCCCCFKIYSLSVFILNRFHAGRRPT